MEIAADHAAAIEIKCGDHAPVPIGKADEVVAAAQAAFPRCSAQIPALCELKSVVILEQSVELRMEPDGGAPRDLTMPPPEEESFTEARQIETVLRTEEGLRRYKSTERSAMSDSDVLAIAESILTQKKRSGTVQNWQYEISPWGDDLLIAFIDVSRVREQEQIVTRSGTAKCASL